MGHNISGKAGRDRFWNIVGFLGAPILVLLLFSLIAPSSSYAQGDRYHAIIIATKDGAQAPAGGYKLRYAGVYDVEKSNRDGTQAMGTMAISGGNVTGSVSTVESDGETASFNLAGTCSPSPAGYSLTLVNFSPPEHYTLNLSPDGEFLMGTHGETENGHTNQANFIAVRGNDQKFFTDSDMTGTWRFRSFELYDIESNKEREAEIYYGTIQLGSGQGSIQVTSIEDDLSTDYEAGPLSYTLRQGGEADFYFAGDPNPVFTGQLSSEGNYVILSSDESGFQQITMAMKQNPAKTFSVANLNGTYRWQLFRVKNFSSNTPEAQNGYGTITFDGAGNWNAFVLGVYVSNGQTYSGQSSGTYSVTPNGEITLVTAAGGLGSNDIMNGYISKDDATIVFTQAVLVQTTTKTGSLQVFIEPEGARSAAAQWRRVGTSIWYNSGYDESAVPVGLHNVEFKSVTGWVKPANAGVSIVENQTTGFTGTYAAQGGSVAVNIDPDNGTWSIIGPTGFEGNGQYYSGDMSFTNAPAGSYTWTGQELPSWDTPSPQTISLSVGGSISFTRSWTRTPAVASFSATPTQGISPLTVNFKDMSWGTIHTRTWNFGDGSPASYETNPTYIYQNPGIYQATLIVAGPLASNPLENGTYTLYIGVDHPPPSAAFTMNPTRGESPLQVAFEDKSTGDITSWDWDFGDGTSISERHPQHTYNSIGVYPVKLEVTGPGGTRSATATVIVYKVLYVNQSDDKCGDKSPCYTSLQTALDDTDAVKLIRVTQGNYPAVQQTLSQTVIIQGGNDNAFSENPSGRTIVEGLTVTSGTVIPENLSIGPAAGD